MYQKQTHSYQLIIKEANPKSGYLITYRFITRHFVESTSALPIKIAATVFANIITFEMLEILNKFLAPTV